MLLRSFLACSFVFGFVACGGQAATSDGGKGGTGATTGSTTSAGASSSAGTSGASGGAGNAGGSQASAGAAGFDACGPGAPRCNIAAVCPATEHQIPNQAACPAGAMCHAITICCSTIWCAAGGDIDAGPGPRACGTEMCTSTQACIASRVEGGVARFADAGTCPTGEHLEGSLCANDFKYACVELNGRCSGSPVTCACAKDLCAPSYQCSDASQAGADAGTDAGPELTCQELVP